MTAEPLECRPFPIRRESLGAFAPEDRFFLRDPRGRSLRPSILPSRDTFLVRGPFLMVYDYVVRREQGVRFVEITDDQNEIHRSGDIVAGALTASKMILPLEVLFHTVRLTSARIKFVGWSRYERRTTSTFFVNYAAPDRIHVEVRAYQGGGPIAAGTIEGVLSSQPEPALQVKERKVNRERLEVVKEFFRTLGIASEPYFDKGAYRDYTYPFAYVASLPSGQIVKQMKGDGGMLNILQFDFDDQRKIPIVGREGPVVRLEQPRLRRTFNRILADIIDGVITYYRGWAVVHPGA